MKDLTKGYPAKVIIFFALPLMIGNILQQVYNLTDSKIVSEYISTDALGAVGATAIISNTVIGFICGLTQGFAIMTARCFGSHEDKALRQYVAGSFIMTGIATILLTLFSELFIEPILELLQTPKELMPMSLKYVRIILAGTVFTAIYNVSASILRSLGDSKLPLLCLAIGVVINIGLDFLFILKFKWGIEGAAYATIISQFVSAACCFGILVVKYKSILPGKEEWKPDRKQYAALAGAGLSMGLMGCIVNIGSIVLQGGINGLGTLYVKAQVAGRRVFDIMMIMIFTFGFAMTTYVSQNLGAGKIDRIRRGIRHVLVIDMIMATLMVIFAYTVGDDIVRWVASTDDSQIVEQGVKYIQFGVLFFYVLGALFILRCSLQGMGMKIVPLISSIVELLVKIFSVCFLVPRLGYFGVIMTEPVSWVVMTIPLIVVYLYRRPGKRWMVKNE